MFCLYKKDKESKIDINIKSVKTQSFCNIISRLSMFCQEMHRVYQETYFCRYCKPER